jgi:hypothetical protein
MLVSKVPVLPTVWIKGSLAEADAAKQAQPGCYVAHLEGYSHSIMKMQLAGARPPSCCKTSIAAHPWKIALTKMAQNQYNYVHN